MLNLKCIFDPDRRPMNTAQAATITPIHRTTDIRPEHLSGSWREQYEERAAIREFLGGQAREHAEAEALKEVLAMMEAAGELPAEP